MNIFLMRCLALIAMVTLLSTRANAGSSLNVPMQIWETLTPEQKGEISRQYTPYIIPPDSYGVIIDSQGVNESTAGTSAGSQLGGAIGSANYIDNAFKDGGLNYSAKSHLGAAVIGAVVGGVIDSAPRSQFRNRYTMKLASGKVEYVEEIKAEPFRHSVGLCVALFPVRIIDIDFCKMTRDGFVLKYFGGESKEASSAIHGSGAITLTSPPPPQLGVAADTNKLQSFQAGDIVWAVNGPIIGYGAPSATAKPIQEFSSGASFEVVLALKEFVKVRAVNGLLVWVGKQSIRLAQPIAPVVTRASQ